MQLEFEVYHQISNKHGKSNGEKLIGVAFIDISSLHYVNSQETSRALSGYYHLVDRTLVQNSLQLSSLNSNALGNLSNG
jgi:hypothetical protein